MILYDKDPNGDAGASNFLIPHWDDDSHVIRMRIVAKAQVAYSGATKEIEDHAEKSALFHCISSAFSFNIHFISGTTSLSFVVRYWCLQIARPTTPWLTIILITFPINPYTSLWYAWTNT